MAAAKLGILVEQGAQFLKTLTFKTADGVPIDLTGVTFRGRIRETQSSVSHLAAFVCTVLDQVTNTGQVQISLSAVTTAAIPAALATDYRRLPSFFLYDIERVNADTSVDRVLEGEVEFSPEATY